MPESLLIYAHYNPRGQVAPAVFHTLAHFRALGFRVVVASTSPLTDPASARRLQALHVQWREVENIGYDFFAWRSVLLGEQDRLPQLDRLVLLNSSVQGPYFDLATFLSSLNAMPADVLGATMSMEFKPHLQSYFLYLKPRAIRAEAFFAFWRHLVPHAERQATIDHHELRLTSVLQDAGLALDAYYRADDARNPSLKHTRQLYARRLPFFKIARLRSARHWPMRLKLALRLWWMRSPRPN